MHAKAKTTKVQAAGSSRDYNGAGNGKDKWNRQRQKKVEAEVEATKVHAVSKTIKVQARAKIRG